MLRCGLCARAALLHDRCPASLALTPSPLPWVVCPHVRGAMSTRHAQLIPSPWPQGSPSAAGGHPAGLSPPRWAEVCPSGSVEVPATCTGLGSAPCRTAHGGRGVSPPSAVFQPLAEGPLSSASFPSVVVLLPCAEQMGSGGCGICFACSQKGRQGLDLYQGGGW